MHPDTIATLNQILSKQLFRNVGNYNSTHCAKVSSWNEALDHCSTYEWENLTLNAQNAISGGLFPTHKDVLNQWNNKVEEFKTFALSKIADQIASIDLSPEQAKVILACTQWDLLSLAMEIEHRAYVNATFFIGLSYWYDQGHFPCGWSGTYPEGKLMIY